MKQILSNYGMLFALLALCVLFSALTVEEQTPTGVAAARQLLQKVAKQCDKSDAILIVGAERKESGALAESVGERALMAGFLNALIVVGEPRDLRIALDEFQSREQGLAAIVTAGDVVKWRVLERIPETHPSLAGHRLIVPETRRWPRFLTWNNLLAIVDPIDDGDYHGGH